MSRVLNFFSKIADARKNKGAARDDSGHSEEEIEAFDSTITINPDDATAGGNEGSGPDDSGHSEDEIEACDKAITINPDDITAGGNEGNVPDDSGHSEEKIEALDKAIAIESDDATAWNNKGIMLYNKGQYEEAIKAYDKTIAIKPDHADAWCNKGVALGNLGQYKEAVKAYDKAIDIKPDDANVWNLKGVALDNLEQYEKAINAYNKVLAIKSDDANVWNLKGVALDNLEQYKEAVKAYNKSIAIEPDDANVWGNKGHAFHNLGQYEKAIKAYNKSIAIEPDDANVWNLKGVAFNSLGQYEEAIKAYDKAIAIEPDAVVWGNKGDTLNKLGQYEEAIKAFDKAIAIDQDNAILWNNKGNVLSNLGRCEEAIKALDKAITIDPDYALAWSNKGIILKKLGHNEELRPYVEAKNAPIKAIAINPDDTIKTTTALCDSAKILLSQANKLFNQKKYTKALGKYEDSLDKFTQANTDAKILKDQELIDSILDHISTLKKNITTCKNAIGTEITSKAMNSYDSGDFNKAIELYEGSREYLSDDDSISKINTNIENCYIGIDAKSVEELSANAIFLLENASNLNEPFKARDILKEADKHIEDAISLSNKRNFRDSMRQLIAISKDIQNQRDIVYDQLSNEEIITGKYNVDTIAGNVPSIAAQVNLQNNRVNVFRDYEFYNGFIRFKMSVTNPIDFVVNDVTLDFDFDDRLLLINKHEPDYPIKNSKILLGNISGNSSKSIAIYLDPMMCSKGTDINCQINYKDTKGQPQSTRMEPKKISVVCPIMKTDSDINIGRLKEFVETLPHRDSKVYQLQAGFYIEQLKNITHEVVQKHDVKHIRTLHTKDGKTCEIWYYGKTKVNSHNIVIRVTISGDTQSIELFAATPTPESLAGLLAEVGREIKTAIDAKTSGDNVR